MMVTNSAIVPLISYKRVFKLLFQFLISPVIAQRIYNDQRDSLITYYLDACTNSQGWMTLETFAPLARALLLMVYQNTYPVKVGHNHATC